MTPPFFLQTEVFTKRPLLFYSPHQTTLYFSFVLTERPPFVLYLVCHRKTPTFGFVSAHPRHFHMWVPPPPGIEVAISCGHTQQYSANENPSLSRNNFLAYSDSSWSGSSLPEITEHRIVHVLFYCEQIRLKCIINCIYPSWLNF